jgi:hypothetical protein
MKCHETFLITLGNVFLGAKWTQTIHPETKKPIKLHFAVKHPAAIGDFLEMPQVWFDYKDGHWIMRHFEDDDFFFKNQWEAYKNSRQIAVTPPIACEDKN